MDQKWVWNNLLHMDFDDPELGWRAFREGVDILPLFGQSAEGCASALLRYQPGARIPAHIHTGVEFLLILRGSQTDERGHYETGTLLINPVDTSHKIYSEDGCVVFAVWEKPVKFID